MRLNLKRPTYKPKMLKGKKSAMVLSGGPFDGLVAYLFTAGTIAFTVPSFSPRAGYYNNDNVWVFVDGKE